MDAKWQAKRGPLEPGGYTLEVDCVLPFGNNEYFVVLQVSEGDRKGFRFSDTCKRDEGTEYIRRGTKMWAIFEACVWDTEWIVDFLDQNVRSVPLRGNERSELSGRFFTAEVEISKAKRDNYVRFRTISPETSPGCGKALSGKARSERGKFVRDVMGDISKLPSA